MFGFLKKLFGTKPTVSPCAEAPYKVEAPVAETTPAPVKKAAPKKAAPKKEGGQKGRGRKPKSKS